MEKTIKRYENGLGDGDYLEVADGEIEISDEIGNISASAKITDILLGNPVGKPLEFQSFTVDCNCGERDCESYAEFHDDGYMSVYREDGASYNTKIDPRYTARIYQYWANKQRKNAQAKAKRLAKKENLS